MCRGSSLLLAAVLVGPFTPCFVPETGLPLYPAEIGVFLLMFGIGLTDRLTFRALAIHGVVGRIAVATLLGLGVGRWG